MESQLGLIEQSFDLRYSTWAREALNELSDCFTITDPCICGHPIVFASEGFLRTVGYSRDEVIGKNWRMFQGPETDRKSVLKIREAVREGRGLQIRLLNYRKDATPFWMEFHMCPMFSKDDGRVINFVGVQVPISRKHMFSGLNMVRKCTNLYEDVHGICQSSVRCCRREVCSDLLVEPAGLLSLDSVSTHDGIEFEMNAPREASEQDRAKAGATMSNILSVLTHYSELTGRLVCRKRCSMTGIGWLGVPLNTYLCRIKQSFILTDAQLPDMPIVYASDAFLKLTGYARHEVLGKNCEFLSGIETDPSTLCLVKESIQAQRACTVHILNYRKDNTSFWNFLHISPVRNASGQVAFFVEIQIADHSKNQEMCDLSPEMRQLSVVGFVKVALRGLSLSTGVC